MHKKRILWLINHTTLQEFEVPLLLSLGYEVFIPKVLPYDNDANKSASINYEYDKSLTLPPSQLAVLNQHNFYDEIITSEIETIINESFDVAFTPFFLVTLQELVRHFKGKIFLRVFGLASVTTYWDVLKSSVDSHFFDKLHAIEERFWFAQAYPHLAEIESPFIQRRALTLPLGLPPSITKHNYTWAGENNKILFVCPRILSSPYYTEIYKKFKTFFGHLPHGILGAQPITVEDDACVVGFQSREDFNECLRTYAVMFYHSEEPRHLHYHPLEAIIFGMPLIYMKKGMLGMLSNNNALAACDSFEEAKKKVSRILENDVHFIEVIRKEQKTLLDTFNKEYCYQIWKESFLPLVSQETTKAKSIQKVVVFLPIAYRGGTLNGAKNIAKMIHLGSRRQNNPVEIIFSCIANYYNIDQDFRDLKELGIQIRETEWVTISQQEAANYLKVIDKKIVLNSTHYMYPTEDICNFHDSDFWFIISDRTDSPVLPLKPYGVFVYDYIQRYIPELFGDWYESAFISTVRNARFVLTQTPETREDIIQYAGASSRQVHLMPFEFNPFDVEVKPLSSPQKEYFIWSTNRSIHKNHLVAIEALAIYYDEFDGKLDVVMTGVQTEEFKKPLSSSCAYVHQVHQAIIKHSAVKKHLKIMGELSISDYVSVLSSAKFLWHPTLKDNGTFSAVEAAYHGVPTLSSKYPQMQYMNEIFQLNMAFSHSHPLQIAEQLKIMEVEHVSYAKKLPQKEFLQQFTFEKTASKYWSLVEGLL